VETLGWTRQVVTHHVAAIHDTMVMILETADRRRIPAHRAAVEICEALTT
jgi:hypothetical protein